MITFALPREIATSLNALHAYLIWREGGSEPVSNGLGALRADVLQWVLSNIVAPVSVQHITRTVTDQFYARNSHEIIFESDEDALLFKLMWL